MQGVVSPVHNQTDESILKPINCCRLTEVQAYDSGWGWERRWGTTIKFHMMLHIGIQARWLNPRLGWTYIDEDFMGLLKALGESCAPGTPAFKLVLKIVRKKERRCARYFQGSFLING